MPGTVDVQEAGDPGRHSGIRTRGIMRRRCLRGRSGDAGGCQSEAHFVQAVAAVERMIYLREDGTFVVHEVAPLTVESYLGFLLSLYCVHNVGVR